MLVIEGMFVSSVVGISSWRERTRMLDVNSGGSFDDGGRGGGVAGLGESL